MDTYENCKLCPRECGADRRHGKRGYCGEGAIPRAARAGLHFYEEPCLSGKRGSGTVFFTGCNLQCVFCQNEEISRGGVGFAVSAQRLAEIYLELQARGAHNVNLVTACHFLPDVAQSLRLAKSAGLRIPVVYNSGGYEKPESLAMLEGLVDIYLPDMKYCSDAYAVKYSSAPGYFNVAQAAIAEMVRQTGPPRLSRRGMLKRGTVVRLLLLPGLYFDARKVLRYLAETHGENILVSVMNQYTPMPASSGFPEPAAPVDARHYEALVRYARQLGVNGYMQEGGTVGTGFIPEFRGEGIFERENPEKK